MKKIVPLAALAATLLGVAGHALAVSLTVQVLDRDGRALQDAVVLIDSTNRQGASLPVLDAVVVQENLKFSPNLSLVTVGSKATFQNADSWDHHVILGPMGPAGDFVDYGATTQLRLAARGKTNGVPSETRVINRAGPHLLGCHLHASMRGYLYAADTPWAGITGGDGKVTIRQVPDGPVKVRIWHPNQLVETPATNATIGAAVDSLSIRTQVAPSVRKKPRPEDSYYQ